MNNHQRRLRAIEVTLTPQQIVALWLRNAQQAGTFEEAVRQSPFPRDAIANAILKTVRAGMRGLPEPVIQRAILQARQEGDLLYLLTVRANVAVLESRAYSQRDFLILANYVLTLLAIYPLVLDNLPKATDAIEKLRFALVLFIEDILILEAAVARISSDHLNGQTTLFRDASVALEEQLLPAKTFSHSFNTLASKVGVPEINLASIRTSIRSEVDQQVSSWENLSRLEVLVVFGEGDACRAAANQLFPLVGSGPDEMPRSGVGASPAAGR